MGCVLGHIRRVKNQIYNKRAIGFFLVERTKQEGIDTNDKYWNYKLN